MAREERSGGEAPATGAAAGGGAEGKGGEAENAGEPEPGRGGVEGVDERRWTAIASESGQLKFKSVPWPTTVPPRNVAEITPATVARFIFSPAHSQGMSRKERIRSALRRWHPDRFGRVLNRVVEKDKAAVERGVGIVVRCLNDLLAQEN